MKFSWVSKVISKFMKCVHADDHSVNFYPDVLASHPVIR